MERTVTRDGQGWARLLVSTGLMQVFRVSPSQSVLRGEQGRLLGC